jgi:hypothetical protein
MMLLRMKVLSEFLTLLPLLSALIYLSLDKHTWKKTLFVNQLNV